MRRELCHALGADSACCPRRGRMSSWEGHRVNEMRRVGHAALVSALILVALLLPHAGRAPAGSRGTDISAPDATAATSAHPGKAVSTGAQFVTYNGVRVTVPATWPVIDLRVHPEACVRFDRAAVYLGSPGAASDCPAHAVGRVDSVWLRTVSAGRTDLMTAHVASSSTPWATN